MQVYQLSAVDKVKLEKREQGGWDAIEMAWSEGRSRYV
jgi:hypothetical protein